MCFLHYVHVQGLEPFHQQKIDNVGDRSMSAMLHSWQLVWGNSFQKTKNLRERQNYFHCKFHIQFNFIFYEDLDTNEGTRVELRVFDLLSCRIQMPKAGIFLYLYFYYRFVYHIRVVLSRREKKYDAMGADCWVFFFCLSSLQKAPLESQKPNKRCVGRSEERRFEVSFTWLLFSCYQLSLCPAPVNWTHSWYSYSV